MFFGDENKDHSVYIPWSSTRHKTKPEALTLRLQEQTHLKSTARHEEQRAQKLKYPDCTTDTPTIPLGKDSATAQQT